MCGPRLLSSSLFVYLTCSHAHILDRNTLVAVGLKAIWLSQDAPWIQNGRGQQTRCRPTLTSSHLILLVPSGEGVCPPDASSKLMVGVFDSTAD